MTKYVNNECNLLHDKMAAQGVMLQYVYPSNRRAT